MPGDAEVAARQRVFNAVAEFSDACSDMLLERGQTVGNDDTFRQMVWSSMLSVYGSGWITNMERDAVAGAALGVVRAFDDARIRTAAEEQHAEHESLQQRDPDCMICDEIEERE